MRCALIIGVFILLAVGVVLGALMLVLEVLYNVHKRRQQLAHRVVSEWRRRARRSASST